MSPPGAIFNSVMSMDLVSVLVLGFSKQGGFGIEKYRANRLMKSTGSGVHPLQTFRRVVKLIER